MVGMVWVITAVLTGPTGRLGPPPGGRPPVVAAFTAGILGGSRAQSEGTRKGGGVSARPLPMPINPALLKHAD